MSQDNPNGIQSGETEGVELITDTMGGIEVVVPRRRWWQISTFSALGVKDFRWFWVGMLCSFAAVQIEITTRAWLVYQMTGSYALLGAVTAAWGVSQLMFLPIGGAVADRVDKRNLIIISQLGTATLALCIAILVSTHTIALWHLIVCAFLSGVVFAFNAPARQAIVPQLVGKGMLMNGISLNSTGMNLMRVAGPPLAGVLIAVISMAGAFFITVLFYIIAAFSLLMVATTSEGGRGLIGSVVSGLSESWKYIRYNPRAVFGEVVEGMGYIRHNSTILMLLLVAFIPILLGMPYMNLMPGFAQEVMGVSEVGYGSLLGVAGVGALVGSLAVASLGDFKHKGKLMIAATLFFGISLALLGKVTSLAPTYAVLIGAGVGSASYMAVNNTLIQSNVTDQIRGRVMSVYMMTFGLMPLGTLPLGVAADAFGVSNVYFFAGVTILVFILITALLRPNLRRLE